MIQVVQVVHVIQVVRMISLDDMHSENIWFSWYKPSKYREKLICHACDGRTDERTDGKWKIGQCSLRPETAKAPCIIDDQVCTIQCFVINPSWVCCMTAQSTQLIQHVRGLFSFHENNCELSKEYLDCRNYLTSFGGKLNSCKKDSTERGAICSSV